MPFKNDSLNSIATEIEKFVKGKLQIGRNKIYEDVKNGGLGMFKISEFLESQCCAWVRRAAGMDEMWKKELFLGSLSSVFNVRSSGFDEKNNPILKNISKSYEKFLFKFTALNENFRKAPILENPVLKFDLNNQNYVTKGFFGEEFYRQQKRAIDLLTIDSCLRTDNTIKNQNEFELSTGLVLSEIKYNRLCGLARTAHRTFSKNTAVEKRCDVAQNFCMRIRRGSKRYRKVLAGPISLAIPANIKKYSDLIDGVINLDSSIRLNVQWLPNYLDNSTRTFVFKLHNNLLGLNSRVAHFVRNHSATCTFCSLSRNPEDNPESIRHLFFECVHTESVLIPFYRWVLRNHDWLRTNDYFIGFNFTCNNKIKVLDLINILTKKYIWDCKLRYNVPNLDELKVQTINSYRFAYKNYRAVREFTDKSEIFLQHNEIRF